MDLAAHRKSLGLSQEQLARELGLASKSYISEIEGGSRTPPLRLAIKIERWSGGKITAASLCPDAAELRISARKRDVAA